MNKSLSRICTLTKRNIKEILRDPLSLIFIIGLPLVMEIMFYLIFSELTSQFEMKYLVPGIIAFSQSFLTLFIGQLISIDKDTSFLTRLFVSKTKSSEFIISYTLSIVPIVLLQSILFYLVGVIFEPSLLKINIIYSILISLVTSLFFLAIGILFGSISNPKAVGGVSSIIINAQSILSGVWFPLDDLNSGFIDFMNLLPFKSSLMLIQNSLNGTYEIFNDFIKPLIIIIFYVFVTLILAIYIFNKKMKER